MSHGSKGSETHIKVVQSYIPGWDCHGLPIEQKALAAIGVSLPLGTPKLYELTTLQKLHTSLTPDQVRAQARQVALDAIDIQKTEMRALGVMADWDSEKNTYRTLGNLPSAFLLLVLLTPFKIMTLKYGSSDFSRLWFKKAL